jgi:hypothetical protein
MRAFYTHFDRDASQVSKKKHRAEKEWLRRKEEERETYSSPPFLRLALRL